MSHFEDFLVKHGLYDSETGKPLVKYAWCCDGPWDLRDFFVYASVIPSVSPAEYLPPRKQMHISRVGHVLDHSYLYP
jgi:hypothetical protein